MELERWREIERVYHRALERPADQRNVFLQEACAGDDWLRLDVQSLLAVHRQAEEFLETPALELTAQTLAETALAPQAATAFLEQLRAALPDRYVVERELGHGGMATVYLAQDRKHDRQVAIKVLRPDVAAVIGADRFLREIAIAARLNHPHIVPLYDSGEAGALLYFVMPYVRGESLRDRLNREPRLRVDDAVQIARQVADALEYAHALGIVHRDIKPENILFTAGHAVVSDFGIAQAIFMAGEDRVTGSGRIVGTPAYMSPEQATGTVPVDGRSDVYSLGCVLYEMLIGEPPFMGSSAEPVLARQANEPTPQVRTVREIPEAIDRAVTRALAMLPTDRFATAAQFGDALGGSSVPPRPARRSTHIRVAATVAIAVGVVAVWLSRSAAPVVLDQDLVAVAPFDVFDQRFELWHEGLLDYLSKSLDGAGRLRTVSPTVVLRRWSAPADPASGSALGRRTGARLVVLGQLVGVGSDSARLRMTLLDAQTGKVLADPERTDVANRIDRLADSATMDLLRSLGRTRSEDHLRLASTNTRSLPALKAFLRGEQFLRRFVLDSAAQAYEEAIEDDARFALALRRLGLVRGWQGENGGPLGLMAGKLNHGLAPRDSLLILADSLEGAADDSLDTAYWSHRIRKIAALEDASRRYPEDPEVWYELGEARFHLGFAVGSTAEQTLEAFDRAIALDQAFAPAYFHPVQLALDRGDTAAATRYLKGYLSSTGDVTEGVGLRLVDHFIHPNHFKHADTQSTLDTASANVLFDAWRTVQRWPDSAEYGVRLLRLLTMGRTGVGTSVDTTWARYLLTTELLYRGHLHEAKRIVSTGVSVPFAELAALDVVPRDTAEATFDRWLNTDRAAESEDPPYVSPCYPSFIAARWWASTNDTGRLSRLLDRGTRLTLSSRSAVGRIAGRADADLARAALALARHDTAEALRQFLEFPDSLCGRLSASLAPGLAPLQLTRFELLAATGRWREASEFFDRQVTIPLTVGAVVAVLDRGRVAEHLGNRAMAIQQYQFVAAVWRDADPELRPYVGEALAGLTRLEAKQP